MTKYEYFTATGYVPEQDDLERVNCLKAGQIGHFGCGWCNRCDVPMFFCGCYARQITKKDLSI